MGHHVQQQLGTSDEVNRLQRDDPSQANALSVRLELQADCYAGVWAHTVFAVATSSEGTSGRRCVRRPRSATTGSSAAPAAG